MSIYNNYRLEESNGNYTIIICLNDSDSEFSKEFGSKANSKLYDDVTAFISEKFPDLNITLCKIIVGSMIVATLPMVGGVRNRVSANTNYTNYTVSSGDTLWNISNKFNTSISDIKSTNNLTNDNIYINQILKIPSSSSNNVYEVKSGDTLWNIANRFNTSIDNIKKLNNLDSDTIYIGQNLMLSDNTLDNNTYVVQSADTLWKISNKFDISIDELKRINNLTSDTIYIGQELNISSDINSTKPSITYVTHTVENGENPWTISIDYGIPMQELLDANNLSSSSMLNIGDKLQVPVHNIPIKPTLGSKYGEHLDWWTEAQYVFTIGTTAKVTDFETGKSFMVKRTLGANHADSEPLTSSDTAIAKELWGGYSWDTRPVLIEVDGRKIAASMSFMPHSIQYINDNNFEGHFDIHFLNSTRHKDGEIDYNHQEAINISSGINK